MNFYTIICIKIKLLNGFKNELFRSKKEYKNE